MRLQAGRHVAHRVPQPGDPHGRREHRELVGELEPPLELLGAKEQVREPRRERLPVVRARRADLAADLEPERRHLVGGQVGDERLHQVGDVERALHRLRLRLGLGLGFGLGLY